MLCCEVSKISKGSMEGKDKESPDVIGGRNEVGFNEHGVGRRGFYAITKLTENTFSTINLLPYLRYCRIAI